MCASAILFSGCIYFESIDQPSSASYNDIFTVYIETYTEGGGSYPYFGVCFPAGWTVPGDSIPCTGAYNETIYYDSLVSFDQENASPAPVGYYWWAGLGPGIGTPEGFVYGELQIQTNDQLGCFSLDYMLGSSYHGVNLERSNNHLVWIVDDYTPSAFQAIEGDNSVMMSWRTPVQSAGLLGYNIYRDQEVINTSPIADTTYNDDNALAGAHRYAISSLYNNGDEHLIPYEIIVIYGEYLYVSLDGDNSNDGSSFEDALLTITYAISIIRSDSLFPKTIMLAPGVYNAISNSEEFPVDLIGHVSLNGAGEDFTILDADNQSNVLRIENVDNITIESLSVMNGTADGGGGIYCIRSTGTVFRDLKIFNNNAINGGGIYCEQSNLEMINIKIYNNETINAGGGLFIWDSTPTIQNTIISGNEAYTHGGGVYCDFSDMYVVNVILSCNTATGNGGGICSELASSTMMVNCITWGNLAYAGSQIWGIANVSYSDVQGGWGGEGNISVDPLFRDTATGDFHLMAVACGDSADSPCIDIGDPNILDRLMNCSWGLGTILSDMGAYGGGNSANVGVDEQLSKIPNSFALFQNYPNPFNASTSINYDLPKSCDVSIEIYDILGRRATTLVREKQQAGHHSMVWNADGYSSGMYFYRIQAGEYNKTKKMLLLK